MRSNADNVSAPVQSLEPEQDDTLIRQGQEDEPTEEDGQPGQEIEQEERSADLPREVPEVREVDHAEEPSTLPLKNPVNDNVSSTTSRPQRIRHPPRNSKLLFLFFFAK